MDNTSNFSNKNWRLNPSEYVAGGTALGIGLSAMILAAIAGHFFNANFDGPIDLHLGRHAPLWYHISEPVISWLLLSTPLYIAGKIFSTSSIRAIDVFGTQAFARIALIPALPLSYFAGLPLQHSKLLQQLESLEPGQIPSLSSSDISSLLLVGLLSIPILVFIAWAVLWMYKAYATSCNIKGRKAIMSFIIVMILAEIGAKYILNLLGKCI